MRRLTVFSAPSAVFSLLSITLILNGCGSGSSSAPTPAPTAGSYTITAAALNPVTLTAGGATSSTITVTPKNGYTGSVNLSCAAISGSSAPTCSFNPNPVAISGTAAGTSTLTISTLANTPGGSYSVSVTGTDGNKLAESNGPQALTLAVAAVIQHVVVIVQENRTPDNLFQDQNLINNGANIATSGVNSHGLTIQLSPIDLGVTQGTNPQNFDLSHQHSAFVSMYDGGKMDGADLIPCTPIANCPPNPQFMYVKPADVQPYFALAEQYTFGDAMFQTNQGPSFPAHQFILAGTSAPSATSNLFAAENPVGTPAGCITASTTTVALVDPSGVESSTMYPCFEHQTLTDLLDAQHITWRYYAPSAGSIWTAPDAIDHICQPATVNGVLSCTGPDWTGNVIIPEWGVLEDIADGQLPQVSWVIPDGANSDHPQTSGSTGPSWVASVVNAIGNSQYWANTAIIITWDDWGGWYDHVAPKVVNDGVSWGSGYIYGFRVPLIVVSPYAKAAYISHVTHDFGSVLKYIEMTFNLPSLGYADVDADDFSDCFNMTQSPIQYKTIPAPQNAAYFINNRRPPTDPDDD